MFGYVIANPDSLTPEQLDRYRSCYCGLCRTLKERHGSLSRFTLTYDMTFLILLLESMYEPEETDGMERCCVHPVREHHWRASEITDYAADMNIVLAYQNCLDDWRDEHRVIPRAEAALLRRQYERCREAYPEKCAYIEEKLGELSEIEKRGDNDPDAGAKVFGELMGELFVYHEADTVWSPRLRRFGKELGEFIYVMDAVLDLESDRAAGRYNPLAVYADGKSEEELQSVLTMLIGECAEVFELLPVVRDADIMRNVLYSGVWTRYNVEVARRHGKKGEKAGES